MRKRVLSLCMAFAMCLSLLPVPVLAEDMEGIAQKIVQTEDTTEHKELGEPVALTPEEEVEDVQEHAEANEPVTFAAYAYDMPKEDEQLGNSENSPLEFTGSWASLQGTLQEDDEEYAELLAADNYAVWPLGNSGGSWNSQGKDWPRYQSSGKYHSGTDIAAPEGTPILASYAGTIDTKKSLTTSYGKHIIIKCKVRGEIVYIYYAHMSKFANVNEGDSVKAGQTIGYVGSTGNSTGNHLHYEVRNKDKYYGTASSPTLNPCDYLPKDKNSHVDPGLDAPTITKTTADSTTAITVKWNAVSGATKYTLKYRKAGSGADKNDYEKNVKKNLVGTSCQVTNLDAGGRYYFRLIAQDEDSSHDSAYGTATQYTKMDITASSSANGITLNWTKPQQGESYNVQRKKSGDSSYKSIATAITNSYTDSSVEAGTKYDYKIIAKCVLDGDDLSDKVPAATVSCTASGYYLDINGCLDGEDKGKLTGYATADVYVNGSKVATGVDDYYVQQNPGASYEIKNIKAADGYIYHGVKKGSKPVSGTIDNSNVYVRLQFRSIKDISTNFDAYIYCTSLSLYLTNDDDSDVRAYSRTGNKNQVWHFERQSNGSYKITSAKDGKVLDIQKGGKAEGTNVLAYKSQDSENQQWYIHGTDGAYLIASKVTECVLDVYGGKSVEGSNINMWSDHGGESELFTIEKLSSYTVSYNANGGSGEPGNQSKMQNVDLNLSTTRPSRSGYTFAGWSTSVNGSVQYQPGDTYRSNASVTLYAVWTENVSTYTVSYNANGGSGAPSNQTKFSNSDLTLSETIPTRAGYSFKGWATSANGSVQYQPGESYGYNMSMTFYAVWESITLTITFDANGGTIGGLFSRTYEATANYGDKISDLIENLPVVSYNLAGGHYTYYFAGWYTERNAGRQVTDDMQATEDTTFYAHWDAVSNQPRITSIELSEPMKKTYNVGESLDTTGLSIKVHYSNTTSTTVTSGYTISGFDSSTAGTKTVSVIYGGYTKTFDVTILDNRKGDSDSSASQIVIENQTVSPGATFTLPVLFKNNPGLISYVLEISYDDGKLELTDATAGDFPGAVLGKVDERPNPFKVSWQDGAGKNSTAGLIVTLTFQAKDGARGDAAVSVSYEPDNIFDETDTAVSFTIVDAVITIADYKSGDANGDDKVNARDVVLLQRYLSGWSVELAGAAADANGDGKVNARDVVLLQRYLSGWNVSLGG